MSTDCTGDQNFSVHILCINLRFSDLALSRVLKISVVVKYYSSLIKCSFTNFITAEDSEGHGVEMSHNSIEVSNYYSL